MTTITLPPLPESHDGPNYHTCGLTLYEESDVRYYGVAVAKAVLEACARACYDQQRGWASEDHIACADNIRALEIEP